ncbi:MAG: type I DNA topoisomerase [Phycisphaerales bacterium]|nr:type I DNA topoisomerase [Phycisphaerales bacterium]
MAKASGQQKILVIVESPAKARTIGKYLGTGFEVESSIGHIRDLPSTAAEIPAEYKDQPWARLGVNVDEQFRPIYIVPADKKAQVAKLRSKLKDSSELYLATDEDREGEAIAWHLAEVLKPKCPVKRMVFDEITRSAITRAVEQTRAIDARLVNAQETRRILDRLYGYEVSPVLWRKVRPKLSAGRVQSVATRLVVDRERARMRFVSAEYWDLVAQLLAEGPGKPFEARLLELAGQRIASGKDFDETTGRLKEGASVRWLAADVAEAVTAALHGADFRVTDVTEKPFTNRPYAPFITSTLQQEAGRKLRFSAQRTMRLAQHLYENGYITYMRTDSTTLSSQAISAARSQVRELYGNDYLPAEPRVYKGKTKNAQEAHEAIRPAGETFRTPQSVAHELNQDELRLYELIWKRTVASQMKDAQGRRTIVRIEAEADTHGTATFSTSGQVITFPGYLRAYVEGSDDPTAELEDRERVLPALQTGQVLRAEKLEPQQHVTQPPARYTEASLIKELEERGIGRPSTYATILQTIQDRGYVWRKGTALVPTFTAFAVVNLLEQHLRELVDYEFTARMEDELDAIASGQRESGPWLNAFYFGEEAGRANGAPLSGTGLKQLVNSSGESIDAREVSCIPIGRTASDETVVVRVGRYGPYVQIGDREQRATVPEDVAPDELTVARCEDLLHQAAQGDRVLGHDPATGKPIYLKSGRFGPYVQLGEPELTEKGTVKRGSKPRMASLWPSMSLDTLTIEQALLLLSFPREVGQHPETGEVITAQDGRFGPYLKMGTETRSLANHEQLAELTLAQAVEILKQPKGRRGTSGGGVLADLGAHPQTGAAIQAKSGRYGAYVTDGVVNATIPKDRTPAEVTLEEALALLAAREQKMRDAGQDPRAPKPARRGRSGRSGGAKPASGGAKRKTVRKRATAASR